MSMNREFLVLLLLLLYLVAINQLSGVSASAVLIFNKPLQRTSCSALFRQRTMKPHDSQAFQLIILIVFVTVIQLYE